MLKVWLKNARNHANVYKVINNSPKHGFISDKLRVACYSYVNHNNEHNVGAPPPKSPPKVNLSVHPPNDNLHNKTTRDDDNHDHLRDDKTENVPDYVTDKAKRGTKGVVETAFNAEGMEKSWGHVKETTEKVKDTLVGNDDDENNENRYGENNRGGDQGYVDKHIEDLRKKAKGYDHRSH